MSLPSSGGEQVIDLTGSPVSDASARLVELAQAQGYTVAAVAPGTYRLARTRRRFLVDKRTESVVVTVFSDRTGTKARIVGALDGVVVDQIVQSVSGRRPLTPPSADATGQAMADAAPIVASPAPSPSISVPSTPRPIDPPPIDPPPIDPPPIDPPPVTSVAARWEPAPSVPDQGSAVDERTVVRASIAGSIPGSFVVLPDGRNVRLDRSLVIGRNPDPSMGAAGAVAVPVAEPSISKTHAAIDVVDGVVWVTDLHSTNGTRVEFRGTQTPCVPGRRSKVDTGGTIIAGDLRIDVRGAS